MEPNIALMVKGGKKACPDRIWPRPGVCSSGYEWKKRIQALKNQCLAASGHESSHSTKNPEPEPVPGFLLSKKKENIKPKIKFVSPNCP